MSTVLYDNNDNKININKTNDNIKIFPAGDSTGKCSVGIWEDMIPFHVSPQGRPSVIVTGYSEKMEMTESLRDVVPLSFDSKEVKAALEQQ